MDSSNSKQGPVSDYYDHGNGPSDSREAETSIDELSEKKSPAWS